MANSKDITRKFLDDVFVIRELDLNNSSISSPNLKEKLNKIIEQEINEISHNYADLESPEKEYLESIKNFYGLGDNGKLSLDTPLKQLFNEKKIRTRVYYGLHMADINYLGEILSLDKNDLTRFRNIGRKSANEIQKLVTEAGYSLGMDINYISPENRK